MGSNSNNQSPFKNEDIYPDMYANWIVIDVHYNLQRYLEACMSMASFWYSYHRKTQFNCWEWKYWEYISLRDSVWAGGHMPPCGQMKTFYKNVWQLYMYMWCCILLCTSKKMKWSAEYVIHRIFSVLFFAFFFRKSISLLISRKLQCLQIFLNLVTFLYDETCLIPAN